MEKSVDGTFFMVTGFGPGGYSGIQQLRGGKRVAIFSLWNNETTSVEFVDQDLEWKFQSLVVKEQD